MSALIQLMLAKFLGYKTSSDVESRKDEFENEFPDIPQVLISIPSETLHVQQFGRALRKLPSNLQSILGYTSPPRYDQIQRAKKIRRRTYSKVVASYR